MQQVQAWRCCYLPRLLRRFPLILPCECHTITSETMRQYSTCRTGAETLATSAQQRAGALYPTGCRSLLHVFILRFPGVRTCCKAQPLRVGLRYPWSTPTHPLPIERMQQQVLLISDTEFSLQGYADVLFVANGVGAVLEAEHDLDAAELCSLSTVRALHTCPMVDLKL